MNTIVLLSGVPRLEVPSGEGQCQWGGFRKQEIGGEAIDFKWGMAKLIY